MEKEVEKEGERESAVVVSSAWVKNGRLSHENKMWKRFIEVILVKKSVISTRYTVRK